jgi:VIT1/CCC1 family predicted Fe2+/Mn2+ transporter
VEATLLSALITVFIYIFSPNYHPLIVSAAAVLIIVAGVTAIIKRGIFRNFILAMRNQ